MLKIRLGQRGSGKTSPTYDEVFASQAGRTVFVVTPCYEGGTPSKDCMLQTPFLNMKNGVDWNHCLTQIKGKVVRVRIDEGLVPFLNKLVDLNNFVLVIDDLQTVGAYPGVRVALKPLFSLCRYRCDIYMTAHFYRKSFGPELCLWRDGADSLQIYGTPRNDEVDEIVEQYVGSDKKEFREKLLNNPKFHALEILS